MRSILPALGLVALLARPASAQLTLRESQVLNGSYETIGNLLIDCPGAGTGTCNNNDVTMAPVDVDTDPATGMSSSATLNLPPAAAVRSAILYITGIGTIDVPGTAGPAWLPPNLIDYAAKLGVGGANYDVIVPVEVDPFATNEGYLARFDVTSLVTASGQYFVADALLAPASHPFNRIMSWALFVSYDDGSAPKLVNLYDGYQNCFMGTTTLNLGGFRTPAAGAIEALFSAWSIDGHPTIVGESITVGSLQLSNAQNPANNLGNSSVTGISGPIPRNPATFRVTEEMDLDTFDASSAFGNGQTSVDIAFTCGSLEGVVYHLATIAVAIVAPQVSITKTVLDLDGGEVVAGDELQYELTATNAGGDDAIAVQLRDPLPAGLAYVPGSIEYGGPTSRTDQPGDDSAEWTGTELVLRIGAGANATRGGTLAVGLSEVVRFRAIVETATGATTIVNQVSLSALGAQGGSGVTAIVRTSSTSVSALPCIGFSNGACPDAGVADAGFDDATFDDATFDDASPMDAGLDDAASLDGGLRPDAGFADTGAADAGARTDATVSVDTGEPIVEEEGCDCSASGRSPIGLGWLSIAWVLFAIKRRR